HLFLNCMVESASLTGKHAFPSSEPIPKKPLDQTGLLNIVRDLCDESANDIAGYLARLLTQPAAQSQPEHDRSLILIKNIRKPIP
ncbi:MAG: hypothetical protein ACK5AC_06615, partial [Planctomycetota bacterium]